MHLWIGCLLAGAALVLTASAAPVVEEKGDRAIVTGDGYRATIGRETVSFMLELKASDGQWRAVAERPQLVTFACQDGERVHVATGRTTWAAEKLGDAAVFGQQGVLDPATGLTLDLHYVCANAGVLVGARLAGPKPDSRGRSRSEDAPMSGRLWSPPRIALGKEWDGYLFWAEDGRVHEGDVSRLTPHPAYAGVSPWGPQGDTVRRLDAARPALIVKSSAWGVGIGVVFVEYASRWTDSQMFFQHHTPTSRLLYGGYSPAARAEKPLWAWLAPFPAADAEKRVVELVQKGEQLVRSFRPISRPMPEAWTRALPDFPAALRRTEPVRDINEAVVFTINETTRSDRELAVARKVGSDVLIRAWFKWHQAPPVKDWRDHPVKAHQMGALFGGGITCSALYDRENGITEAQLHDMATRSPAGQLLDAWDTPGIRHGSLSSPAYLDYLFRWCREQMDAGADYLFMDEHTAALALLEGYDDHSLRDFRGYLREACAQTQGWTPNDARWASDLKIDLADREVCPTAAMDSFDYRAFLRKRGLLEKPSAPANPLNNLWAQFRVWRDDRAWKALTDRIRAYAKGQGRTVLISANGIARYVDLQVLGVWGAWKTKDGHVDLSQSQLPHWRSLVLRGHAVAEKRVPVVLFHDWGFGDPPFPWLAVPASEREVWIRTRGAEIYAAGGFFAFPVLGPFGCDASRDGTLHAIVQQTTFCQTHRNLFLRGRYAGSETLMPKAPHLSVAAWWTDEPRALLLHV
ncbi:MAG: hypothetical protein FJ272_05650, partial [Planctomycetes bacterium]|nr:hypothetical protein [Planctomycetota bacterium]